MSQNGISTALPDTDISSEQSASIDNSSVKKVVAAAFAIVFATIIIGATGFAPGYAHNAAHDARHVMVFPCH